MQTFLPYPDFAASAAILDDRRLGKQRVEALQVLRAVTREAYGCPEAIAACGLAVCDEWVRRRCADTCAATIQADLAGAGLPPPRSQAELARLGNVPGWLGDERLHRSHQAALVRKNPEYYQPLFPDADRELPYFWPTADHQTITLQKRAQASISTRPPRRAARCGDSFQGRESRSHPMRCRSASGMPDWQTERRVQRWVGPGGGVVTEAIQTHRG